MYMKIWKQIYHGGQCHFNIDRCSVVKKSRRLLGLCAAGFLYKMSVISMLKVIFVGAVKETINSSKNKRSCFALA